MTVLALLLITSCMSVYIINHYMPTMFILNTSTKGAVSSGKRNGTDPPIFGMQKGKKTTLENPIGKDMHMFANYVKFRIPENGRECSGRRFLVYTCNSGKSWCGGWGDGQKGITSLFLLALLTNRTFVIDMQPCNLSKIVQPNIYNWNTCLSVVRKMKFSKASYREFMNGALIRKFDDIFKLSMGSTRVIRINTNTIGFNAIRKNNLTRIRIPWLSELTDAEVTGSVLGMLFKPSFTMYQNLVQFFNEKVSKRKLICSHIRYGSNPTIAQTDHLGHGHPNVTLVFEFLKAYDKQNNTNVIFVATDADHIRNQCRKFSSFVSTERNIVHIEKTNTRGKEYCNGFFNAVFEQILLSKCDVLILTRSNFGAMAAYMRGTPDGLFLHQSGKAKIFQIKRVSDIQKIYRFV